MSHGRGLGSGCAVAIPTALTGAAIGWWATGPPRNDPELHALVGLVIGAIVGFAAAGPRGSAVISGAAFIGTILGGLIGGLLTQDNGLGTIAGILIGAGLGLVAGALLGVAVVAGEPEE